MAEAALRRARMTPDLALLMETVARRLLGDPNAHLSKPAELRFGSNGSLSIDLQSGVFYDHEAKHGGGILDLICREKRFSKGEALAWLREERNLPPFEDNRREAKYIEATYNYTDEYGKLIFQTIRYGFRDGDGRPVLTKDGKSKKTFSQRQPFGSNWAWNLKGARPVPYRLPELVEAIANGQTIFIPEGEKKVDKLMAAGVAATCNAMGAKKWRDELTAHFAGAKVVILRDNDKSGREHGALIAEKLKNTVDSLLILDFPGVPEKGDVLDWLNAEHTVEELQELVATSAFAPGKEPSPRRVVATPFKWREPRSMPRRQFLYGRHIARGFVSVTGSFGGVGKTSLKIVESIALVTGHDLLGDGVPAAVPVWYLGLEDPLEEYERRVIAAALQYGIPGDEIEAGLFLDSGRDQNFVIATETPSGVRIAEPIVGAIIENLSDHRIGCVVVDPFVASHSVSENDNNKIEKVTREWARIAQVTGCGVELVHHLRKGNGTAEPSVDDLRGGTAVPNAARSVRILAQMTKNEASNANVLERRRFFKITLGKANLFLPPEVAEWRELKTVSLGNGNGGPDDEVQVAARWTWPNALDGLHVSDLNKVQDRIASGEWAASAQASDWAGYAIAEVLGLDLHDSAAKARVKTLLRVWISDGALKIEPKYNTRNGRMRPMVVVGSR
jgi:hypothetical protein